MNRNVNSKGFTLVEILIVVVLVAIVLVGGLYRRHQNSSEDALKSSSDTGLVIKRDNPLNQPGVDNFSKTVSHSSAVTILNDINSLKPVLAGTYNCPNDDGVAYSFSFSKPTLNASASTSGCQSVTLNDKSYQSTGKFWKDVSSATHEPIDPNKNFQ